MLPRFATEILRLDSAVCLCPVRVSVGTGGNVERVAGGTGVAMQVVGAKRLPRDEGFRRAGGFGLGGLTTAWREGQKGCEGLAGVREGGAVSL